MANHQFIAESPVGAEEFNRLLSVMDVPEDVPPLIACSGGPDSIALVFLADRWARRRGQRARVACVDHGLRPESAIEAEGVARTLASIGIETTILRHEGTVPKRDIQAAARAIRFRLLTDWVLDQRQTTLFLAHHQDDQAETVLLRLARGSGVDGLSAMSPVTDRDGISLLRPLLNIPKSRLLATASVSGLPFVTDPSNSNRSYARVRMRSLRDLLAWEGLTPTRLAETAARMARARAALEVARDDFLRQAATADPAGFVTLDPGSLAQLPEEVALRVLSHILRIIGGRDYPPREEKLIALHRVITSGALSGGRTLTGVRIAPWRGTLLFCREAQSMAAPVRLTGSSGKLVWDNRFDCRLEGSFAECSMEKDDASIELSIGALGLGGLDAAKAHSATAIAALPGNVRITLPALWSHDRLIGVPHIGLLASGDIVRGSIGYRSVSDAWGEAFRHRLPFSNPDRRPM